MFSRILSPECVFCSHFFWEEVPRKTLQENPRQDPPKVIPRKSPQHSSAEGPGQRLRLPQCFQTIARMFIHSVLQGVALKGAQFYFILAGLRTILSSEKS